jgi:hypothetical protein
LNPTILDVIQNFWGADPTKKIEKATKTKLKEFGKEVNRFYEAYSPIEPRAGDFRSYCGGLVAVNFSLNGKQQTFFNNLLYSHSTIVPDPIARWYFDRYEELARTPPAEYLNGFASVNQAEWFGWMLSSYRAFQWDVQACKEVLAFFVSGLSTLKPLVDAGIVVFISQPHALLPESTNVVNSAVDDANDPSFLAVCDAQFDEPLPLWDNVRGGIMTPGSDNQMAIMPMARWAAAKEAAYHIRKNLLIARSCGGVYVPENRTDFALLSGILKRTGHMLGCENWDMSTAQGLKELKVPSIEGLPLVELIAIRKDGAAFEEFRLWLARRLMSPQEKPDSATIFLTSEEIEAEISRLRQQLSTSSVIKDRLKQDGITIAVRTVIAAFSTAQLGGLVLGAAAGALAGIASALFARDTNTVSVLAKIARINRTAADATIGRSGIVEGVPRPLRQPFFGEFRTGPKPPTPTTYTKEHLRKIVGQSLRPNTTGNPIRAIPGG